MQLDFAVGIATAWEYVFVPMDNITSLSISSRQLKHFSLLSEFIMPCWI